MHITLDEERWEMADDLTLEEILAEVSDKAHARQRVVTCLEVGGHKVTDRDLQPVFLSRRGREFGTVQASSRTVEDIVSGAGAPLRQYGALLRERGAELVAHLRQGTHGVLSLDAWLGPLADYIEAAGNGRGQDTGLPAWIAPLLDARAAGDAVRLADILEYEVLARLPEGDAR